MSIKPALLALGLATAAACASSPEAPPPATPAAATPSAAPSAEVAAPAVVEAPASWDLAVTQEQKIAFMKAKVVPAMEPIFKAADPAEYGAFGCATCHGPEYKATTEFLPALEFKDNKLTAFEDDPEVAKFMAEQVTPKMAEVLGKPAFNPETHEGFGCGGCHAIAAN